MQFSVYLYSRVINFQHHIRTYSGTSLIRTPLGPKQLTWLVRCPYFRKRIICIYIQLELSQVSWLTKVSLFQRIPLREVPLYTNTLRTNIVPVVAHVRTMCIHRLDHAIASVCYSWRLCCCFGSHGEFFILKRGFWCHHSEKQWKQRKLVVLFQLELFFKRGSTVDPINLIYQCISIPDIPTWLLPREQATWVRMCNYVKFETGQNFPSVLKIVTGTVHAM